MATYRELTSKSYRTTQRDRVAATAMKISSRSNLRPGRVIPDADDLAIHEGRFLNAAVLFLDISGFTGRPQETRDQQEQLLQGLSLFFTEAIRVVEDFGGVVEKNTGDWLMAYFAREADEDASKELRSLTAAITLFDAMSGGPDAPLSTELWKFGVEPFRFRICIDSGPLTVAKMGAAQRFNGVVAIGTTANLACKMLNVAQAGEIMIGNNVATSLPEDWRQYLARSDHETGYQYTLTGLPYYYWYYTGRWIS